MAEITPQYKTTLDDVKAEVEDWPVIKDARALFQATIGVKSQEFDRIIISL